MGVMVSTNISFAVYIIIKIVLHLFFVEFFINNKRRALLIKSKFIIVIDGYINTHPIRLQLFDLLIYPVPF